MSRRRKGEGDLPDIATMEYSNPWFRLADAIVLTACKDYHRSLELLYKNTGNMDITNEEYFATLKEGEKPLKMIFNAISLRNECEHFLRTDTIYIRYYDGMDGVKMLNDIHKKVEKDMEKRQKSIAHF